MEEYKGTYSLIINTLTVFKKHSDKEGKKKS